MLINGYGATIGTHHLAGICALVTEPYVDEHAGEIVGLYTITRFKGEGVGGRLVARVLDDARQRAARVRLRLHHRRAGAGVLRAPRLPPRRHRRRPGREVGVVRSAAQGAGGRVPV